MQKFKGDCKLLWLRRNWTLKGATADVLLHRSLRISSLYNSVMLTRARARTRRNKLYLHYITARLYGNQRARTFCKISNSTFRAYSTAYRLSILKHRRSSEVGCTQLCKVVVVVRLGTKHSSCRSSYPAPLVAKKGADDKAIVVRLQPFTPSPVNRCLRRGEGFSDKMTRVFSLYAFKNAIKRAFAFTEDFPSAESSY